MRAKHGKMTPGQNGDIAATDPIGQPLMSLMTIECKCGYAGATFADVVDARPKTQPQVWQQFMEQVI